MLPGDDTDVAGAVLEIDAEDRRDIPVADMWEPVPEFGNWASISRFER